MSRKRNQWDRNELFSIHWFCCRLELQTLSTPLGSLWAVLPTLNTPKSWQGSWFFPREVSKQSPRKMGVLLTFDVYCWLQCFPGCAVILPSHYPCESLNSPHSQLCVFSCVRETAGSWHLVSLGSPQHYLAILSAFACWFSHMTLSGYSESFPFCLISRSVTNLTSWLPLILSKSGPWHFLWFLSLIHIHSFSCFREQGDLVTLSTLAATLAFLHLCSLQCNVATPPTPLPGMILRPALVDNRKERWRAVSN